MNVGVKHTAASWDAEVNRDEFIWVIASVFHIFPFLFQLPIVKSIVEGTFTNMWWHGPKS